MKILTICIRWKTFHITIIITIIQPFPIVLLKLHSISTITFLTPRPAIKQLSFTIISLLKSALRGFLSSSSSFLFPHFLNQFHPTTTTAQTIFIFFFSFMLSERYEGRVFFFHQCCYNFPFNFPSSHHTIERERR